MRIDNLARALFLFMIMGASGPRHPLPSSAQIKIGAHYIGSGVGEEAKSFCRDYHLTKAEVRKMFRTYRELRPHEMHDNYLYVPCGIEGTVIVNGKTYTWRTQIGGTLDTTWPDGIEKTLGGEATDGLSEGEAGKK